MEKFRILHLEDDPGFVQMIQSVLKAQGVEWDCLRVDTREAFAAALGAGGFELILADHDARGLTGFEALEMSLRLPNRVPFIFLTGAPGETAAAESMRKGASDCIHKSSLARFVPAALRILRSHREYQALAKTLETMHRDRTHLRALIENTGDAIWSMDFGYRILAFNSAASLLMLKISGRPMEVDSDFLAYLSPGEREWWREAAERGRTPERQQEHYALAWQGWTNRYEVSFNPIRAENAVTGFAVYCRDVTDRDREGAALVKARDLAEEASKAKGQFLANMSHEIRTPMNGVMAMAGLLSETALDAQQRQYLRVIQASAQCLLTLINDILDFSRSGQAKLRLQNRLFDLHETVEDCIALFAAPAEDKGLDLQATFVADTPRMVKGDAGRLRQILVNLVGNAVNFTPKGSVHVRVGAAPGTGGRTRLRLEVEDTGIGIGSEAGQALFEALSKAGGSENRPYGELGSGLAVSRELAAMMEGEIGFTSHAGKGSLFWFTATLQVPERGAQTGGEGPADRGGKAAGTHRQRFPLPGDGPPRILVAEDNVINQTVIVSLLEKLGLGAEVACNGLEALRAFRARRFDLILMDCHMPELDGFAATARIRRLEKPGGQRVKIVAMTADALEGTREKCLAAGMDDYLTKPILRGSLATILESTIGANARMGNLPAVVKPRPPASGDPPAESGGYPSVDTRVVNRLRSNCDAESPRQFAELVAGFLQHAEIKIRELGALLRGSDLHGIAQTAHALKGLSMNFGAVALARECDDLQRREIPLAVREAEDILDRMASRLAEAKDVLCPPAAAPAIMDGGPARNAGKKDA